MAVEFLFDVPEHNRYDVKHTVIFSENRALKMIHTITLCWVKSSHSVVISDLWKFQFDETHKQFCLHR